MAAAEAGRTTLCFNGDFNWFNVDDSGFRAINERVLQNDAIKGNVEVELCETSSDAGCGCAYPETVDQGVVERSNQIHAVLKHAAAKHTDVLAQLDALPTVARYRVGEVRIGVVHGDAESLAGWRFDVAALDDLNETSWRADAFAKAAVDVFASSHTCLPAARRFNFGGVKFVVNNGAAGMPNALGTHFGILTRIGTSPSPHPSLYGDAVGGVMIDALAIHYDNSRWQEAFLTNWPPGSPAWMSYFNRIANGPHYSLQRSV